MMQQTYRTADGRTFETAEQARAWETLAVRRVLDRFAGAANALPDGGRLIPLEAVASFLVDSIPGAAAAIVAYGAAQPAEGGPDATR